jgi:hypothetical protein
VTVIHHSITFGEIPEHLGSPIAFGEIPKHVENPTDFRDIPEHLGNPTDFGEVQELLGKSQHFWGYPRTCSRVDPQLFLEVQVIVPKSR